MNFKKRFTDRLNKVTAKLFWGTDKKVYVRWFKLGGAEYLDLNEFEKVNSNNLQSKIEKHCEKNGLTLWSY